ncbi:MAG: hypothetical protein K8T10_01845 [Candidatus Eremiobacteraeota bacterium]|nr:hypothetical protein [Candidatus Eremiobacteraeota bacterium]
MDAVSRAGNNMVNRTKQWTGIAKKETSFNQKSEGIDNNNDSVGLSLKAMELLDMPKSMISPQEADTSRSIRG